MWECALAYMHITLSCMGVCTSQCTNDTKTEKLLSKKMTIFCLFLFVVVVAWGLSFWLLGEVLVAFYISVYM